MAHLDVSKLDITKTNAAIDRLLEVTDNPRHRFMLHAYYRHRYLEIAGRYEEIFAPEMMSDKAIYHFHAGETNAELEGKDAIKSLYKMWAETNQNIFYVDYEEVAVADHYIASVSTLHQQVWGGSLKMSRALSVLPGFLSERILKRVLASKGFTPHDDAMYLYSNTIQMIWPYDDECRLIGEDVWEPDPEKAVITKLDASQVLTAARAAQLLEPYIKPLPSFDEVARERATGRQPELSPKVA
ncbi:hypothetical protein [Methylobacterium sp. WSM2598]|uniref:hypothetical protein n=1 Tax=Methylobacterium sp. WSM2598 TaxID=398261 RepID=UPI0003A01ECA|nr:hypothetical protein [Methylobacterium sp. WSM2598]